MRADGTCAVCRSPRKPERSKMYGQAQAELDPFCSSDCCRLWHENPRPAATKGKRVC